MTDRFGSILPPNASPVARVIEQATARIDGIAVEDLSTLWSPQLIRADLLPWLAWGLSIDGWNPAWPEAVRRDRTMQSIEVHRHKGTAKSLRDVVAAHGGAVQIREWWQQTPRGRPYTFELVLVLSGNDGEFATARYVDEVMAEVDRVKPVRCHYEFIQGMNATSAIGIASAVRPLAYARLATYDMDQDNLDGNDRLWNFANATMRAKLGELL